MCERLFRMNTMISIKNIKKMWLLPIICLVGGAVLLFLTDLRFQVYENINISKYIKSKFDVSDSLVELELFDTQYDSETTPTVFTNQVGENKPENVVETISIASKWSL